MPTEVKERQMGRFSVKVDLVNNGELDAAKRGNIPPEQVRRAVVSAMVDTGATRLVIPEAVARRLGLEISGTSKVRYAKGQVAARPIARNISLSFGGRESVFDAVVEPARDDALLGAEVLEGLDFVVDCTAGRLLPRDPEQIVSEIE